MVLVIDILGEAHQGTPPTDPLKSQSTALVEVISDPLVKACYMGDYNDATADESGFYISWGDNRRIIKTSGFLGGRPDPDVRFRALELTP